MLPGKKQNPVSRETLLEQFRNPPFDYGPVDCWWWEAGRLDKKKMRWQLEEMKEKGVAGTFYYPRFVYDQPLRSNPHYWSDGWWEFTKFSVEEHQRLGLQSWFDDWTAHDFFQNKLRAESKEKTALTGRRLMIREVVNTLANHMSSYPTTFVYEGQMVSGLLGPVKLQFLSEVTLTAMPAYS